MATQFKRQTMYHKTKKLFQEKFKVTQICREVGKDPKTISKSIKAVRSSLNMRLPQYNTPQI